MRTAKWIVYCLVLCVCALLFVATGCDDDSSSVSDLMLTTDGGIDPSAGDGGGTGEDGDGDDNDDHGGDGDSGATDDDGTDDTHDGEGGDGDDDDSNDDSHDGHGDDWGGERNRRRRVTCPTEVTAAAPAHHASPTTAPTAPPS